MSAVLKPAMTLKECLDWENAQPEKHEFHRGEIFAMTGGRRTHARVMLNHARHIAVHRDGTDCQVFADSMKVQVADDTIPYPDVFVTCDWADLATEQIFRSPQLVIEVLSTSTQADDRSKKSALCRRIPALQEYILDDPDTRRVAGFRRGADGWWVLHDMSDGDTLEAACPGLHVPLAEVFAGIEPPPEPAAA